MERIAPTAVAVTQATFEQEVLRSGERVIVDFWAPWCRYCRAIAPVLEDIAADHGVKLVTINTDEEPGIAARYGVQGIPNVLLIEDGKPTGQAIGAAPKAVLVHSLGLTAA
jgi:thioredoxin 1